MNIRTVHNAQQMMKDRQKMTNLLNKGLYASILLLALAAPLSIAAAQTAWSLALLFWLLRLIFVRPVLSKDGMTPAVLAFVGLTLVSSFFSYEPAVSLRKMVGVSLVTIVYLAASAVTDAKRVRTVVIILLVSATFTALYAVGLTAVGRDLKVVRMTADSPLRAAGVLENDTIVGVNGRRVSSPDELASMMETASDNGVTRLRVYRYEVFFEYALPASSAKDLGIAEWSRGRDVRAAGFFGHYTTYAEALQLIGSLALGLLILVPGGLFERYRLLLAAVFILLSAALFLTVTRASWAGFAVSAAVIVLVGAGRKVILICVLCAIPVAAGGLYYLQQKRNVAFVDTNDGSTTWRTTVWREGVGVLFSSPRHLAVGIGMDSIKTHWQDWKMFDNGHLPMGHMHSTPLEFAFERGVPTLIAWIVWMFLYLRMLWRSFKNGSLTWFERGVLLGCIGGTAGFLAGGLVHYNWGDSEVVMIFYLLMGLSLALIHGFKKTI